MTYPNQYNEFWLSKLSPKRNSLIQKDLPKDGNRIWKIIEEPLEEPVTVEELKIFSRIDGNLEDDLLFSFIQSARQATEKYTGRSLIKQKIRMKMDFWPDSSIEFPDPPLMSVEKIALLNENDEETIYDSNNYYLILESIPGKLVLKKSVSIPTNFDRTVGGFLFEYYAGYGELPENIPRLIRDTIKLWASILYETREIDAKNPPPEVKSKLSLFKTSRTIFR